MTQNACEGSSVTKLTSHGMGTKWENLNSCDGADDGNAAGACQSFDHGGAQLQWIGEETDRFVLNMIIIIMIITIVIIIITIIIMIMKPGQREELVQPGLSYINSSSPLLTPMALSQVRSLVMAIISITIIAIIVVIVIDIIVISIIISLLKSTIKRFRPNSGFDLSALLHRSTGLLHISFYFPIHPPLSHYHRPANSFPLYVLLYAQWPLYYNVKESLKIFWNFNHNDA